MGSMPAGTAPRRRSAFTLAEMLVSSVIMAILMLGIASSLKFASVAAEDAGTSSASNATAVDVLDRLTTDIKEATSFTVHNSKRLAFYVPDRNADGLPEKLDYNWSGMAGAPLLFVLNDGTAVTLASNVTNLDFHFMLRNVRPPLGACCLTNGSCIDDTQTNCTANAGALYSGDGTACATTSCLQESPVLTLFSYDTTATPTKFAQTLTKWPGQYFKPTLPANTVSWKITSVRVKVDLDNSPTRPYFVGVFAVDANNKPKGSALASKTLNSSALPSNGNLVWVTATFATPLSGLDSAKAYAVVVSQNTGTSSTSDIEVAYHGSAPSNSSRGWTTTTNSGGSWAAPSNTKAMLFYVDGTYTTMGPPQ